MKERIFKTLFLKDFFVKLNDHKIYLAAYRQIQKIKLIHLSLYKHVTPYLGTIYFESNFKEHTDMRNQYRIKNLKDPTIIRKAASKIFVDTLFNDPSIIRNTAHVDFNDENLNIVRFVKVNSMPVVGEHLTAKSYVVQGIFKSVDESTLVRNHQDKKFNDFSLASIKSITLNTQVFHDYQVVFK